VTATAGRERSADTRAALYQQHGKLRFSSTSILLQQVCLAPPQSPASVCEAPGLKMAPAPPGLFYKNFFASSLADATSRYEALVVKNKLADGSIGVVTAREGEGPTWELQRSSQGRSAGAAGGDRTS
jgi:hypothetical protein